MKNVKWLVPILFLIAALSLGAHRYSMPGPANLLTNTDFEAASNSTFQDYTDASTGFTNNAPNSCCTDPDDDQDNTTGWGALNSATLSSEAGGNTGNCLKVLESGGNNPRASAESLPSSAGTLYTLSFYHKDVDTTGDNPQWRLYDESNAAYVNNWQALTAVGAWTQVTYTFEVPAGCASLRVYFQHTATSGDADAYYFDDVSLSEATPAFIAADTLSFDSHTKTNTLDVYRTFNAASANTYGYGAFFPRLKKGADTAEYYNFGTSVDYRSLQPGQWIVFGAYIYSDTATDNVKLSIHDGVSEIAVSSSYVGANAIRWIEVAGAPAATASTITPRILLDGDTNDVAYVSLPVLKLGTAIGHGKYSPGNNIVYLEKDIVLTDYDFAAGLSDTDAAIDLEAQTQGKIGKRVRAVKVAMKAQDSAVAASIGAWLGPDTTYAAQDIGDVGVYLEDGGNDNPGFAHGWVRCNASGDPWLFLNASGAGTLDLEVRIQAVQIR